MVKTYLQALLRINTFMLHNIESAIIWCITTPLFLIQVSSSLLNPWLELISVY